MSELYDDKYQLYRNYYNKYIIKMIPRFSKVLDVGCSGGQLGRVLKNESGCSVYGIDISQEAIAEAKKYLINAVVMDIESHGLPFIDERFDIIILGDVLEHLKVPANVLLKLKLLLNPTGRMIVSLPNVANVTIRLNLLLGRWNYKPSGILDETHLRFFTLKTMKQLFQSCELKIEQVDSTPGFDFFIAKYFRFLKPVTNALCKCFPTLFSNQFIFLLSPRT